MFRSMPSTRIENKLRLWPYLYLTSRLVGNNDVRYVYIKYQIDDFICPTSPAINHAFTFTIYFIIIAALLEHLPCNRLPEWILLDR